MAAPPITILPAPTIQDVKISVNTGLSPSRINNMSDPRFDYFQWGVGYSGSNQPFLVGSLDEILNYINNNVGQFIVILYGYNTSTGYSAASYNYVTVGCPPADFLEVIPRNDALKFNKNYEILGLTFSFYKRDFVFTSVVTDSSPCSNQPGTQPLSYSMKTGGGTTYDRISSVIQRIKYTSLGTKQISLVVTNPFGQSRSNVFYDIIDYPTAGISVYDISLSYGITNGYAQQTSSLLFTANPIYYGGHSLSDINFRWTIEGNTYNGQTLVHNFSTGGTYIVGLSLMSLILGSVQKGFTSELYVGLPVIPNFYYEPIVGATTGTSITFGIYSLTPDYGLGNTSLFDNFYNTEMELPEQFNREIPRGLA